MGQVVLLQASPMVPATGAAVAVRLAGGGGRPYVDYLGFSDWRGGLNGLPRFTTELGFDQNGWTGGALPQTAVVLFKGSDRALMSTLAALFWKGARVLVVSGDDTFGAPAAWFTEMTGTVADSSFTDGALQLTIADLSGDLAKPVAPDTFAGTGGVEGADDATGRIKRRTWGRAFNIEGRLIDKANSVYEFSDPARPLQAFDMLKDKGRAGDMTLLAWQGSIAATFAALQAATAPQGGGVVAPSIAMAKWWTVPSGPLTADLRGETLNGYAETPTDIVSRVVATRSTINPVLTLTASRAYPAGLHVDDASETIANALDRLLLPCSLAWSLSPAGTITIGQWTWDAPTETLVSQEVARQTVFSPLLTRKLGFQKNQRVQNDSEISSVLLLAVDATYADGTPIEALKPAAANADVTSANSAASIFGQGPGATATGTQVLNSNVTIGADGKLIGAGGGQVSYGGLGGGALGLLANLYFGNSLLLESNGGTLATLANFKTILGSAASFFGQGAMATLNFASLGSRVTDSFGTVLGNAQVITGQGTAASFFGQAALATLSYVKLGATDSMGSGLVTQTGLATSDVSLITNQGTAASIFGQGFGATAAQNLVDNRQVATGDNRLVNSGFQRGLFGFNVNNSGGMQSGINNPGYFGARQVPFSYYPPGLSVDQQLDIAASYSTWNGSGISPSSVEQMKRFAMPVVSGDQVYVRALVAIHRCTACIYGLIFDKNGTFVQGINGTPGGRVSGAQDGLPNSFDVSQAVGTVTHPNAAYMAFMIRMIGTAESNNGPFVFWTEPAIGKLPPGQTAVPPYKDGPTDPVADQTAVNSAASIYGQGALAIKNVAAFGSDISGLPYGIAGPSAFDANGRLLSERMVYEGVGTVQSFRPQEGGANITENRSAASFYGQAALATKNYVKLGGSDGQGSGLITESGFGTSDASLVTSQGSAMSVYGQGALATRSSVAYGDGYTFGFNYLATLSQVTLNTTTIKRADGTTTVSETMIVTEQGSALSFFGQGALATLNTANTANITANAVTNTLAIKGTSSQVSDTNFVTLASGSLTTRDGARVQVTLNVDCYIDTGAPATTTVTVQFRVDGNATEVLSFGLPRGNAVAPVNVTRLLTGLAAGAHNFSVVARFSNNPSSGNTHNLANPVFIAQEFAR